MSLALWLMLVLSAPHVRVAAAPVPQVYRAEFRPRFQAFGYAGRLTLYVSPDGYISGTYRPQSGGGITTVRGGREGDRVWFDVQTLGGVHVEGHVNGRGVITGIGTPLGPQNRTYVFTATPQPSP